MQQHEYTEAHAKILKMVDSIKSIDKKRDKVYQDLEKSNFDYSSAKFKYDFEKRMLECNKERASDADKEVLEARKQLVDYCLAQRLVDAPAPMPVETVLA